MKIKTRICLMALLFGVVVLNTAQGWAQPEPEAGRPTIVHAFAVDKGYYGGIWKIYLEAEHPKTQMLRIACSVDQPGYGHYPADWLYVKPEFQKHFKGYIQWNTFSSKAFTLSEGTQIVLRVSVFDRPGRKARKWFFHLHFCQKREVSPNCLHLSIKGLTQDWGISISIFSVRIRGLGMQDLNSILPRGLCSASVVTSPRLP